MKKSKKNEKKVKKEKKILSHQIDISFFFYLHTL